MIRHYEGWFSLLMAFFFLETDVSKPKENQLVTALSEESANIFFFFPCFRL